MIRVLVVDDSALMRRLLHDIFARDADFTVAMACDGVEALEMLHAFRPDVVTLDVNMPQMNGLACLERIMAERPCPVVMLSAVTREGAEETISALSLGAVDFVSKPVGSGTLNVGAFAPNLVKTVRSAAQMRGAKSPRAPRVVPRAVRARAASPGPKPRIAPLLTKGGEPPGLVLVGASTGGPPALDAVLAPLPENFPWPILVAQHMPAAFTAALARRLDSLCALNVVEVDAPVPLEPGRIYIGRGNADVIVSARPGGLFAMSAPASPDYAWHPSVDRLVESACAAAAAEQIVGVLLTGMGDDGARSMHALRAAGGYTIAESEQTAVVWGMPGALTRLGGASETANLPELAERLLARVTRRAAKRKAGER